MLYDNSEKFSVFFAAIMLFGRDDVIFSVNSVYRTDAFLRKVNFDRYDDRLIVQTNLIENYYLLLQFTEKHLWDKFYLENDIFRIIVPLDDNYSYDVEINKNFGINFGINDTQKKILSLMNNNPTITAAQISEAIRITKRQVETNINKLKTQGLIERVGANKNGKWIVNV